MRRGVKRGNEFEAIYTAEAEKPLQVVVSFDIATFDGESGWGLTLIRVGGFGQGEQDSNVVDAGCLIDRFKAGKVGGDLYRLWVIDLRMCKRACKETDQEAELDGADGGTRGKEIGVRLVEHDCLKNIIRTGGGGARAFLTERRTGLV